MVTRYADQACHETVELLEIQWIAKGIMRLKFASPKIAQQAVPGQFVMIRISQRTDPLIGRALAIYRVGASDASKSDSTQLDTVELVYQVKGKMTSELARLQPGQSLDVWGPLGNGFSTEPVEHLVMVAGGIGQTPFLMLAQEALGQISFGTNHCGSAARTNGYAQHVHLLYGARSVDYFAGLDDFRATGLNLQLATDDGSHGPPRRVTDLLDAELSRLKGKQVRVACCGPEPMMESVSRITAAAGVPCEVSLETPMACGIGICFTCVAKVKQEDGEWDYKRTCVEGPIFDACSIEW